MKNVLILSSDFTGHGHKSIATALCERFSKHDNVNVHVVDGFSLGGNPMLRIGKLYGSVTRNAKDLWKLIWDLSLKKPSLVNELVEIIIRDNFLKLLSKVKPDLILSVHPNFNAPVINILNEFNIQIPFITLLADLVSISPLWADPRADYIICPTKESMYKCIEFGVPESKLKIIGFPIREKFTQHIGNVPEKSEYDPSTPLKCLIMSGGEGSGNMSRVAKALLKNFNCKVRIIAGRNSALKKRLENSLLYKYPNRVEIYGFVENIQDFMIDSDIAFTRGSPNTMLEAVMCNTPVLITGALPGQEEGNPEFMIKHNLGVLCENVSDIKNVVSGLLSDNARKLNEIKEAQRKFRDPDAASKIVDFLLSIEKKGDVIIPVIVPKFKRIIRPDRFILKSRRRNVR